VPRLLWVEFATGSLGQGLPIGVGLALTGGHLDRIPYRIWILCGDSELAEGSVWEAFEHAGLGRLGQPDGNRRCEPAGPAGAHPPRLGP
jgi:transketolase